MSFLLFLALAQRAALENALRYLSREVPAWKQNNGCYSCHNNGDAARALMVAGRRPPVEDTLAWLAKPEQWDHQQADAPFRDKGLARIQFAFALAQAVESGMLTRGDALERAAARLVKMQSADGSWPLDQEASVGSPATYGTALATYASVRTLRIAGKQSNAVEHGLQWLRSHDAIDTPDVAAKVLAFADKEGTNWLLANQTKEGGWGPYRASPAEVFDTAIAVIALLEVDQRTAAERGVAWLVRNQLPDGGWEGTTRPSGFISYAQHISTTGWATLALLKARR
jgi:squalene cyclase